MITLRDLAKSDKAIGCITTDECHLIAAVLDLAANSWLMRLRLPKKYRDTALSLRMLAATLGRTPEERSPSLQTILKLQMERDRHDGN